MGGTDAASTPSKLVADPRVPFLACAVRALRLQALSLLEVSAWWNTPKPSPGA